MMTLHDEGIYKSSIITKNCNSPREIFLVRQSTPQMVGVYIDPDLCDKIVSFFDHPDRVVFESSIQKNNQVDRNMREGLETVLSGFLLRDYLTCLEEVLSIYLYQFPYVNTLSSPFSIKEPVKIQKTNPPTGGFHKMHYESAHPLFCDRLLVFMTYLNTVDDGGETEFPNQKLKIKPSKGLTLIWPANVDYPHRGLTSPSTSKYVVTGWYNFITP